VARSILIALLLLVAGTALQGCGTSETPPAEQQTLIARPCGYTASNTIKLECYWLPIDGTPFRIPVARLSKKPFAKKAVFYIPGGPGQGAQTGYESLDYWVDWYQQASLQTDFVLYTPRGLPGGKPYWLCSDYETTSLSLMKKVTSYEEELEQSYKILEKCLRQYHHWLLGKGVTSGIRTHSTRSQASDLLTLIKAMHYKESHIWGVSYGTRVALKAAELSAEDSVRPASLILDSVYPFSEGRQSQWAEQQQRAMELLSQYYQEHGGDQPFDTLWRNAYIAINKQTGHQSTVFTVENWWKSTAVSGLATNVRFPSVLSGPTAEPFRFVLASHRLVALSSFVLYDSNLLPPFFEALERLQQGDAEWREPMHKVVAAFVNASFDPHFSSMAFFATECTDNKRESDALWESASNKFPQWSSFLSLQRSYDACRSPLFQGDRIGQRASGVKSALIVAGEFDHVTPLAWAETLTTELTAQGANVLMYTAKGTGHSVFYNNGCRDALLEDWINGITSRLVHQSESYCKSAVSPDA